jgi:hypothetical protein
LRNAIVDMGNAIMNLEKMRNKQEKLQWVGLILSKEWALEKRM